MELNEKAKSLLYDKTISSTKAHRAENGFIRSFLVQSVVVCVCVCLSHNYAHG